MIDLHNHILPGVDDGAADLGEALEMARMAALQGTTVLAATPHRFSRGREYDRQFVEYATTNLQSEIDRADIPLRLVPGIELPMRPGTLELLRSGQLCALGGKRGATVLMEPPFDRIPALALPLLGSLQAAGYTPLIAHPERNAEVQKDIAFVETCAGLGMAVQLTAGSILGKFGARAEAAARKIVAHRDWKIVLASDAHEQQHRVTSDLKEAALRVAVWLGGSHDDVLSAHRMVDETPRELLVGVLSEPQ